MTLAALCERPAAEHGLKTDTGTLSRFFTSEGISFKKACCPASRSAGTWREGARVGSATSTGLIPDASPSSMKPEPTNMLRTHGRCRRGERLHAKAPQGHWKTLTFIGAPRHDRIDAPCVIDGPINGASFTAYVEQFLIPTLRPGDIVILDNLGSHKGGEAVRKVARAAGARLLFLSSYGPDLNPIEQVFAKLKTLLKKAAERTVEATWKRIGTLLDRFTPAECANYIANAQLHRQCKVRFYLNAERSKRPNARDEPKSTSSAWVWQVARLGS